MASSIGAIVTEFGGVERTLDCQPIRWVREIQTKTGFGPLALHSRLLAGLWLVDEIRTILHAGLMGGGMDAAEAERLLKTEFDNRPYSTHLMLARALLAAAIWGGADHEKKAEAANQPPTMSETNVNA